MTRLGWTILGIIALAAAAFVAVTDFSITYRSRRVVPEAVPVPGAIGVPVAGVARAAIADSWGDAREGGARAHHGTDIIAPDHTPVVAAAPGFVEKLFQSAQGGTTLYVRSPDRRWSFYYAHLAGYARDVREGMPVRAGTLLGYVGDTGDAGPGNYHLHFGVARMQPGERWWQGQDVNPYPLLAAGHLPR